MVDYKLYNFKGGDFIKKLYLRNIKRGFATNSSSYHSTIILSEDEFNKWKNGEINIENLAYSALDNDEHYEETGYYYYIESQTERVLDNDVKVIAITYCETNEM